jgi:rod shape-determining protein MreC
MTVMEIAAPVADVVNLSLKGFRDFWRKYLFLIGVQEENRRLRSENTVLLGRLNDYSEGYYEGLRLRSLLALKESFTGKSTAARVVDNNHDALLKTILIDKGTSDGLSQGLPVLSAAGAAGRVMDASCNYSRVLLLIDGSSNIDAVIQGSRTQCILQGTGRSLYKLKYVPHTVEVAIGDVVLSSGMAGVFPKGLILGNVVQVNTQKHDLFKEIYVAPSVDFERLEEVLVLLPDTEKGT